MRDRRLGRKTSLAVAAALLVTSLLAGSSGAEESGGATSARRFERVPVAGIDPQLQPALRSSAAEITVMLELEGEPVARQQGRLLEQGRVLSPAGRSATAQVLKSRQDALRPAIEAGGGRIVSQVQHAYNGVKVRVAPASVRGLAALPGVIAVHGVARFRPDNVQGVQYIGGDKVWDDFGATGSGVKVAVIDTGIDYYHADFGGSGDPRDFAADNGLTVGTPAFPNAKVVGGTDLVGDAYDAEGEGDAAVPHPDPDPLDCAGHGSHVAGTAAGLGVLSDGSTFHGPYNGTTYASNSFEIGPGVAPRALLYAYRVFGCEGSTEVVTEAIDRAVADGVDVINMSLGSDFAGAGEPSAVAAENATAAGVIVVASAGNAGPNGYLAGSPANADHVISVAALDTVPTLPVARIEGPALGAVTALNANEAALAQPVSGPLRVLGNGAGGIGLGCDPADYAGVQQGDVVVTLRGVCPRVDRAKNGEAAGAAAVIMVNSDDSFPPLEGRIPGVTIPFLGVKGSAAPALLAADGTQVTISDAGVIANPGFRALAPFTSGGPRSGDSAPKPDVSAPGVSIQSVGVGLGTEGVRMSGTSMASPFTAGAAALVAQRHPGWSPAVVRAALMNTASTDPSLITNADVRLTGSGVVRVRKAVDTSVIATTEGKGASLAYGYEALTGPYSETKTVTLTNHDGTAVPYDLSAGFTGNDGLGASVQFTPPSVTVPAHGQAVVAVTVSLSATAVAALPRASREPGRVTAVRGIVAATPTGPPGPGLYALHVPFLLAPRGLSNVTVNAVPGASGASQTVDVANQGIHAGSADVFAWGLSDPADVPGTPIDVRAVGVQSLPGPLGGLRNADRLLVFAVNTHDRWSSAGATEFDIAVDTGGSPQPEFFVVGADIGLVLAGTADGRMGSFVFSADGRLIDLFFAEAPMNGSTLLLPVAASSLKLRESATDRFTYSAAAFDLVAANVDAVGGSSRFAPWHPAVSQGDFVPLAPGGSARLSLTVRQNSPIPPRGWMIVSLDDPNGPAQADLVRLPAAQG